MAKDPTQGPVSTYDAEGNPIITNVDAPVETEEVVEEAPEETTEEEVAEEVVEEEGGEEVAEDGVDLMPESEVLETLAEEVAEETAEEEEATLEDDDEPEDEATPEEDEAPEEAPEDDDEPEEEAELDFEIHDEPMPAPLTYSEAETMLMDTPFLKLREIAIADDIKPKKRKMDVVRQLLDIWFAPSEVPKEEGQPEMSVRIRRAKGLM